MINNYNSLTCMDSVMCLRHRSIVNQPSRLSTLARPTLAEMLQLAQSTHEASPPVQLKDAAVCDRFGDLAD